MTDRTRYLKLFLLEFLIACILLTVVAILYTEKFHIFQPTIIILAIVAFLTYTYLELLVRFYGKKMNSTRWLINNRIKLYLLYSIPCINIFAPAWEEMACRVPLIIAFDSMSAAAWCWLLVSSVLFGFRHWWGCKLSLAELATIPEDDLSIASQKLQLKYSQNITQRRCFHVASTFLLGIVIGYCGIKYQSIWLMVGIHSLWNLIGSFVITLPLLLLSLICGSILLLWRKINFRRTIGKYLR